MTQVGDRILVSTGRGAVEAQVRRMLPGGQAEVVTADVLMIDGRQENVFVVESFKAYKIVRPA